MDDLMRHWLWMQTMEYAVRTLKWKYKNRLYPDSKYHENKHIPWQQQQTNIFTHILEHWESPEYSGLGCGDDRYSVGQHVHMDASGVVGKYKDMEVTITWPEVKAFIRKMLEPEEDKQLTLFELLAKEAMK